MIDKKLQIKINDYVEDNMTKKEKKEFEDFLELNEELRVEVLQIKSMISDLKNVRSVKLGASFDDRLKSSIESYNNKKQNSLSIFRLFENPVYASLGAVAAIFLVVIVTISSSVLEPAKGSMVIDSNQVYEQDSVVDNDNKFNDENEERYEINRNFDLQRVEDSKDN
tara:strand:+ start:702 stop:1202 length:501 start_codon:yes stop_codon:yes gene_type:complete